MASTVRDPSTQSNYDQFRTKHTKTNFTIDFAKHRLTGEVRLKLDTLKAAKEIVLDTSFLDVHEVAVDEQPAQWVLDPRIESLGSALRVTLARDAEVGKAVEVAIKVSTTEHSTALQWLTPQQTSNKKHPYMFSQCQSIHARSVFPCQDTPDVKSTFEFRIHSPLPVITSGKVTGTQDVEPGNGVQQGTRLYTFQQDVPIPSYLFAVASGDVASVAIGPRSEVITGPEELAAAKWELEESTESFIATAEKIVQSVPYAWGTYSVLVLPPSFPYGAMENPQVTFAMPGIISGDRENVDVTAHEICHSWSGNLVSNASWDHFWLNEGWTRYLERRIIAAMHGEAHRAFSAIIGWKLLVQSVERFGAEHEFTRLVLDLRGKDVDEADSKVPYEKGFTFLYYLEQLFGQPLFDRFIAHYFATFAGRSLDSDEFKTCLTGFFEPIQEAREKLRMIDWNAWYYQPGYPPKPQWDTTLVDQCYTLADRWLARKDRPFEPAPADVADLRAKQLVVFLEYLEDHRAELSAEDVHQMGEVYGLEKSGNIEVVTRYLALGLHCGDETLLDRTVSLLGQIGRIDYVRPLFNSLAQIDRALAIKTFEQHKDFYHPIVRQMVMRMLSKLPD